MHVWCTSHVIHSVQIQKRGEAFVLLCIHGAPPMQYSVCKNNTGLDTGFLVYACLVYFTCNTSCVKKQGGDTCVCSYYMYLWCASNVIHCVHKSTMWNTLFLSIRMQCVLHMEYIACKKNNNGGICTS